MVASSDHATQTLAVSPRRAELEQERELELERERELEQERERELERELELERERKEQERELEREREQERELERELERERERELELEREQEREQERKEREAGCQSPHGNANYSGANGMSYLDDEPSESDRATCQVCGGTGSTRVLLGDNEMLERCFACNGNRVELTREEMVDDLRLVPDVDDLLAVYWPDDADENSL